MNARIYKYITKSYLRSHPCPQLHGSEIPSTNLFNQSHKMIAQKMWWRKLRTRRDTRQLHEVEEELSQQTASKKCSLNLIIHSPIHDILLFTDYVLSRFPKNRSVERNQLSKKVKKRKSCVWCLRRAYMYWMKSISWHWIMDTIHRSTRMHIGITHGAIKR